MLSITPTPRSLTPILASMPYSVTVCTTRPSGCGMVQVNQPSLIASYQSHVCTATGGRPGGSETTVEHSVWPVGFAATRISVRALIEATASTGTPAPSAMPAISSACAGATRWMVRQARADQRSTSNGPSARASNSVR